MLIIEALSVPCPPSVTMVTLYYYFFPWSTNQWSKVYIGCVACFRIASSLPKGLSELHQQAHRSASWCHRRCHSSPKSAFQKESKQQADTRWRTLLYSDQQSPNALAPLPELFRCDILTRTQNTSNLGLVLASILQRKREKTRPAGECGLTGHHSGALSRCIPEVPSLCPSWGLIHVAPSTNRAFLRNMYRLNILPGLCSAVYISVCCSRTGHTCTLWTNQIMRIVRLSNKLLLQSDTVKLQRKECKKNENSRS